MLKTDGLFDIQINGYAGVDFNAGSTLNADMMDHALEAMLKSGVTHCLPTLITATFPTLQERFKALDEAVKKSRLGPLMVPGYHLEGPFLNPAEGYCGCHPASAMCKPDVNNVLALESGLSRPIIIVTYAPEFDDGETFAANMLKAGKLLAIGHSAADNHTVTRAAAAGLKMSTHLGNGVPQTLPKLDNTLFAQLSCDVLSAGFIADGIHIPPHALKSLLRAKGLSRSILVTDAVSAAGIEKPGLYPFAGMEIERTEDGSVRVPGSRYLAGSSLTLDQAIRNIVNWGFADFKQAVAMASEHPRRLLKPFLDHHTITLPPSSVIWDENGNVLETMIGESKRIFYNTPK